jgi:uncharacterized protein YoxC
VIDISKNPSTMVDALQEALTAIDTIAAPFRTIKGFATKISSTVSLTLTLLTSATSLVFEIMETPVRLIKTALDTVKDMGTAVSTMFDQGKMTIDSWATLGEVVQSIERYLLGLFGHSVAEGAQSSKDVTLPIDKGIAIDSDTAETSRDKSLSSYSYDGLILYTVKGNDTLQSIALDQLGDEELWPYIASVNDYRGNDDLNVGTRIYIPVVSEAGAAEKDSFVITEDAARNPYGSDIKIDEDGRIVVLESNDVALISGIENVKQAINLRLATEVGSMIKQTAFGLAAQPGLAGTTMTLKYVRMSLKDALLQDSRIEDISNLSVTSEADRLSVSMDISIVGYDTTLPVDVVL